ncbi:trehalose-phosphatase [Roseiarcus sp.]|uniref:trehalose-phosphatase n=1 Tax=Roseiarcus sp. TaxID=1969460 RepID=UPI003F951FB5
MRTTFASTGARRTSREDEFDDGRRIALFLDVDGTLLDLAERPDEVTVPRGLLASVAGAQAKTGGALALVSGRTIADLDRFFAPLRLPAAGVHGAELRLDPGEGVISPPGTNPLPPSLWTALTDLLQGFPGTIAENKRFSYAVHYRLAPAVGDVLRRRLATLLKTAPYSGITMLEAHCAFELKTREFDKGRAIATFLSAPPFLGRTPIFIGDDDTDEAGFAVVSARGGRAFSVGRPRPGATATFGSPSEVRGWLAGFAGVGASV